jgi:hypothetical protein
MNFLPLYAYFIAASFLVSLLVYRKNTPIYLRLFPPFLLLTLVAEIYGSYLYTKGKNNIVLYNFFSTFEFVFYLYILRSVISNKKVQKIIWIVMTLFVVAALFNLSFVQKKGTFHSTIYATGCLLIVIFCIYYFLELFRFPQSGRLYYNPAFWICTSLLFFYCCGFPLYGLLNEWSGISSLIVENFTMIVTILNIFLYSLFSIAFICVRTRKCTLSPS